MFGKNYKIADWVQGAGSIWLFGLLVLYFANRRIFFELFNLSLLALVMILILFLLVRKRRFNNIFKEAGNQDLLEKIKQMKPEEFEDFIGALFRRLGYQTHRVGDSVNSGIDVTAEKDGVIHYIQCKKFANSEVGLNDIRAFHDTVVSNSAIGRSIFISANGFSTQAIDFAKSKSIEVIDGIKLIGLVKQGAGRREVAEVENKRCPRCCG